MTLLSDEVYRGLEVNEADRLPQAAELTGSAVSLNVMSKSYGLPGLRIGWLATRRRDLLERLERRKHYTSICNATPSEALAALALRNGAAIQGRNRDLIAANVSIFEAFFAAHPDRLEWQAPVGGCVSLPALSGRRWRRDVLHRAGRAGGCRAAAGEHLPLRRSRFDPHFQGPAPPSERRPVGVQLAGRPPIGLKGSRRFPYPLRIWPPPADREIDERRVASLPSVLAAGAGGGDGDDRLHDRLASPPRRSRRDLHLSETAVQWLVTAYALSTAAFVALGGRLGDILGHKQDRRRGRADLRRLAR